MKKYLFIVLLAGVCFGQDCIDDDGTEGVELWSDCYSIENTVFLDLYDLGIIGIIPTGIGNLTNLTRLLLNDNQLTGPIPSELGNLINLIELDLDDNQLTGPIPSELGNLINLIELDLDHNQLTGSIPSELGNLINLIKLDLDYNQLTDSIPSELGNLINLIELDLDENQLTGSIPSEIGNLMNLEHIDFAENLLTGSIPLEIGNLTNLDAIKLHQNQLSGPLSEIFCSLSNLTWSLDDSSNLVSTLYSNNFCPPYPPCLEGYLGQQNTTNCLLYIDNIQIPNSYKLYQNFPNPFNPITSLRYDLPKKGLVNITIFDMMGRIVKTLVNGSQTAGFKSIQWNATNDRNEPLSAGLYLYTIQASEFRQTRKMVLLK